MLAQCLGYEQQEFGCDLQVLVHLFECVLGLLEETKDDPSRELARRVILVHLEDLLECRGIDRVSQVELCGRTVFRAGLQHGGSVS